MATQKTPDELEDELPEAIVQKYREIDRNIQSRPDHLDLVYLANEHHEQPHNRNQFTRDVEEILDIPTSWETVETRCNDLCNCGIFEKNDQGENDRYYLSGWAKRELGKEKVGSETGATSNQSIGGSASIQDSPVDQIPDNPSTPNPSPVEKLLASDRGESFRIGIGMNAIGGIFFAVGLSLVGTGLLASSGQIIVGIGGLGIIFGTALVLYSSFRYHSK